MYPIVYHFKLTVEDYREMSFFSTFSYRKSQNIFLLLAWIASVTAFLLDMTKVITLTQTVHICTLMVTVTLPMLLVSVWMNVRKFKLSQSGHRGKEHTVLLGQDNVQYRESGNSHTGLDKWDDFIYAFETKKLFLLFRTQNNAVLLPKRDVSSRQIEQTRACLKDKFGVRFKIRCKIAR
jgi:hypothetical protein